MQNNHCYRVTTQLQFIIIIIIIKINFDRNASLSFTNRCVASDLCRDVK